MNINKKLKRKSYFIVEAIKIIEENGVGKLTARVVANAAGFNAASIYNYFDNMDHLENLASIYFTEGYAKELTLATKNVNSALESYLVMWELFIFNAFKEPDIFYNVFYSVISQTEKHNLFFEYYELFPTERPIGGYIDGMMEVDKTSKRGLFVLNKCVEEGSVCSDMIEYINDIHIGYTKCVMTDIVKNEIHKPNPQLFHKCMEYIVYSMSMYVGEEYRSLLNSFLNFHKQHNNDYSMYHEGR